MDKEQTLSIIHQTFQMIFGKQSPVSLETLFNKFAFDIKLPKKVQDNLTKEETWSAIFNSTIFITQKNMNTFNEQKGWMLPKQEVKSLNDIISIWKKINYTTTERQYDCINVSQCDPIYRCENAFRCSDCSNCKNIIFCDGCSNSTFIIASQRSAMLGFCLRVDDSNTCTNSYNVICSNNISNSFFIQDCNNLHECMFCSHISNKKYCISNMQFKEEEYFMIKNQIINWIFDSLNQS